MDGLTIPGDEQFNAWETCPVRNFCERLYPHAPATARAVSRAALHRSVGPVRPGLCQRCSGGRADRPRTRGGFGGVRLVDPPLEALAASACTCVMGLGAPSWYRLPSNAEVMAWKLEVGSYAMLLGVAPRREAPLVPFKSELEKGRLVRMVTCRGTRDFVLFTSESSKSQTDASWKQIA